MWRARLRQLRRLPVIFTGTVLVSRQWLWFKKRLGWVKWRCETSLVTCKFVGRVHAGGGEIADSNPR